jgi:hypothetical protein|tara:strand:- start:59 stop:454 length:396 start_codon:yes stop_codon:yes gene_type:complete
MSNKILDIPVARNHPDYMKYYSKIRREKVKKIKEDWAEKNREKKQSQWRDWYSRNKKKQLAKMNMEKAEKLKRTPTWGEKDKIAEFYENCPDGHHVDHVIPLRGKNVSGLHVLGNLQYLTAKENFTKGNKF